MQTTEPTPPWLDDALTTLRRGRDAVIGTLDLARNLVSRVDTLVTTLGRDSRRVAADAVLFWSALSTAAAKAKAAAKATPRIARVMAELARIATTYRFAYIKAGFLSEAGSQSYLAAVHTREGTKLRLFCESLGGGILKLGQVLSTRADLLPKAFVDELTQLQDAVPAPDQATVEAALDACLTTDWRSDFTLESPLAAASLAIVYKGRLADGTPVAVKVQRPEVDRLIAEDRAAMELIAAIIRDNAPGLAGLDIEPILREVAKSLIEELDFVSEAAHADRFRQALPAHLCLIPAFLRPPHPKVLVMELVVGSRLPDALAASSPQEIAHILGALAKAFAEAILVHGLVHGDPHPGNVLVLPPMSEPMAPRLALLDFGSAVTLDERTRRAYTSLLFALMARARTPLALALGDLGFTLKGSPELAPSPEALAALADSLCDMPRPADLASIDPKAELERALTLIRAHDSLVMAPHLIRVGRALGTLGGLFMSHQSALTAENLDLGRLLLDTLIESSRPAA